MADGDDGTEAPGAAKRRRLEAMLGEGIVMLHLDPRAPEVVVPAHLKVGPVLRLNIAYGFRLPALEVGDDGVYAVLSFSGQNFGCTIPWGAVFALTSPDDPTRGAFFPESVPRELRVMLESRLEGTPPEAPEAGDATATPPAAAPRPIPMPRAALATAAEGPSGDEALAATAPQVRPKPSLTVLKGGGTPEGDPTTANRPRPSLTIVKE